MDTKNIGHLIKEARIETGYTQKSLADVLYVSDKAVSKWERGISTPDSSILPKLSMLLDIDIENLIPNKLFSKSENWHGVLDLTKESSIENIKLYDKPLIDYLLSYFMLVGISNITIKGVDKKYIKKQKFEQYGLNISFEIPKKIEKKMIVYGKTLLFGSNITRLFKSYMDSKNDIKIYLDKRELPILFVRSNLDDINEIRNNAEIKTLGRGIIDINLNDKSQIKDGSKFVEIYQKYHKLKIADLTEIAHKRNIKKLN